MNVEMSVKVTPEEKTQMRKPAQKSPHMFEDG